MLVVAGTVQDFDRDGFVANLASFLTTSISPPVAPSDIDLTVAAASVQVTARIRTRNPSMANAVVQSLADPTQASPSALSQALNVQVVSLESVVVEGSSGGSSGAPSSPSSNAYLAQRTGDADDSILIAGLSISLTIGIIIVVAIVGVVVCLVGVCVYCCCCRKSKLKAPTTTVTVTSTEPAIYMENATADSKI
jgi:hypothetical protein